MSSQSKSITIVLASVLSIASVFAQKLVDRDVFQPATAGSVRLKGFLGNKLDVCLKNRLLAQDIEAVVAPFRSKAETGSADWRSEYWGKWFTSLALADSYRTSHETRAKLLEATQALIATHAEDGYIGTRTPAHRLEGWDVWGCKYVLLGLIADFDRSHDPAVLLAAKRECDVLISELGPGKVDIADVGEWNGLPASSVLEPIVLLYDRTLDRKYLDFATYIVSCWSRRSQRLPNGMRLIEDALAGKHPDQMCAPKAYEMMSCFEGLCELYRATGKPEYLQASIKIADGIFQNETTLVGVGTSGEVWFSGANKQTGIVNKPMETCVTVTWMKFCEQLLRLTGEVRYADELEKNLYNGLLGSMMPDGRWWAYFGGMMGVRVPSYVQHSDVNLSCCVVNGPRGLMLTPSWAFMEGPDGPVVNLYSSGSAQVGGIKLDVIGDYPVSDHATIQVTPPKPETFTLSLRIPDWSKHTLVSINGHPETLKPGYTKIRRTWHAGDRVAIVFDMRARVVTQSEHIAILRGPVVLAIDNRLTARSERKFTINRQSIHLKPNPTAAKRIGAWMAFDTSGITLCDYASAGNAFSEQNIFRTWLPQTLDLSTIYDTGQTWQTLSHASVWTNPPQPRPRVEDRKRDLALATNGATASADSEYDKEPGCIQKLIDSVISTPGDFSNRWHSSVNSQHPHWVEIHLAKPARVSRIVIHFADPAGYPVSLEAAVWFDKQPRSVFSTQDNHDSRTLIAKFAPVLTDRVRLTIRASANPKYPNAAQLSEVEIYE